MRKIFLFLMFSNWMFSQEIPPENYFWEFNDIHKIGVEAVIGVKNCYVRKDSTSNSQLVDSLQIGDKIKVLKNTNENLKIKGLNLSWVEIEYSKKNQIKSGFLWKGFIALGSSSNKNTTFLTTLDSKYTKKIQQQNKEYDREFYRVSVKAIDSKNKIISEKSIAKQLSESNYFQNSTVGSWGLQYVTDVYRISFSGQACAVPSFHYYFGWDGKEFLLLPEKYEIGDAGAYYHAEEFIFPKEKGGQSNTIIKHITEATNTDDNSEINTFLITKLVEYYSWDGKKFKYIKTKKLKPYLEKEF